MKIQKTMNKRGRKKILVEIAKAVVIEAERQEDIGKY